MQDFKKKKKGIRKREGKNEGRKPQGRKGKKKRKKGTWKRGKV